VRYGGFLVVRIRVAGTISKEAADEIASILEDRKAQARAQGKEPPFYSNVFEEILKRGLALTRQDRLLNSKNPKTRAG
jgi:hypothetical protein